jgi:hypothetical protein
MKHLDRILSEIASEHLNIPTLRTRKSDSLDFHEVSVWAVRSALKAAFDAGARLQQCAVAEMVAALKETLAEIEYVHGDMLTAEERSHPRGSGWARVYDRCQAAIAQASPYAILS